MEIGYRIIRPEDLGAHPLSLAQISLWEAADWDVAVGDHAVRKAVEMAAACRKARIRTVFHPIGYPLTGEGAAVSIPVLQKLATVADWGIIIHDEGEPDGSRLSAKAALVFEKHLHDISRGCHVSVENSFNSSDSVWFWERFVAPEDEQVSITLDIGHLESADIDAIDFVHTMPGHLVRRVKFVHMHHKGEDRNGVVDHWPLVRDCREIEAMKVLLSRLPDPGLRVILELDAREAKGVRDSIALLEELQ